MHPIITAQAKVIRTDPSNKLLFVWYAYSQPPIHQNVTLLTSQLQANIV